VILFFYPLDFTFVCPTGECHAEFEMIKVSVLSLLLTSIFLIEITAFSDRYEEFEKLNTEILGVSVDSIVSILLLHILG